MRYGILWGLFVLSGVWLVTAAPAVSSESRDRGEVMAQALEQASAGNWSGAASLAARVGDEAAGDLIVWTRLQEGIGEWADYERFLALNGDWPGLSTLRRAGEHTLPADMAPPAVITYFDAGPPQTGAGARRLAAALVAVGNTAQAEATILQAWSDLPMSGPEQSAILAEWEDAVAPHHVARLDHMLWNGYFADADRMMPLVDEEWRLLAKARIMTRRDEQGLQAQIHAVPTRLKGHPGLAFERYLYRTAKGRWEDAEVYLREKSASAETLGRPEMWMERRANLARQALRAGDVDGAYALAANSFGSGGADYADSEWMAGYIALIHLEDPKRAVEHFERFGEVVATPISRGRAGYWLGLAHERAGDAAAARAAFEDAALHQTSFYGQLAAEHAGLPGDPEIAGGPEIPNWRKAPIATSSVIRAAELLLAAGYESRAMQFFRHAADGRTPAERAALAQMARDLGRPHIGLRIAKDAARDGIVLPEQYFPLHAIAAEPWPVPTEFALAVARQESELNAAAASPAGAQGLMQLMPRTAEDVATGIGVAYAPSRLVRDPTYNARLGTAYLARMLKRYGGSYMLAAAAYNAGPGRVDSWLEDIGDPRGPDVDPIVWIESIPYSETRNYVMRVLEGLHVYRARLTGDADEVRLAAALTASESPDP